MEHCVDVTPFAHHPVYPVNTRYPGYNLPITHTHHTTVQVYTVWLVDAPHPYRCWVDYPFPQLPTDYTCLFPNPTIPLYPHRCSRGRWLLLRWDTLPVIVTRTYRWITFALHVCYLLDLLLFTPRIVIYNTFTGMIVVPFDCVGGLRYLTPYALLPVGPTPDPSSYDPALTLTYLNLELRYHTRLRRYQLPFGWATLIPLPTVTWLVYCSYY